VAGATVAHDTRILLADDEEPNLKATVFVLRGTGFDVTAVPEGNHANLAFEVALLARRPYDLLLLDIRMPGASGWEVPRYVREHTPPGIPIPGILLKPFTNSALVNEVRRHLAVAAAAASR